MFRHTLAAAGAVVILAFTTQARGEPPLDQDRAIAIALDRNTELRALAEEVSLARAELAGASVAVRGNPELEAEIGPRFRPGESSTLDLRVGLVQPIEIGGQRGARMEVATAAIRTAEALLRARRNELTFEVKRAFARVLASRLGMELASAAGALATDALRAAEERMRAGSAAQIEVNSARVEVGRAVREKATRARELASARAELSLLLGLDAGAGVDVRGELRSVPRKVELEAALEKAHAERADVRAARETLDGALAADRLSGKQAIPDIRIGAAYAREEGANVLGGLVGIPLPLFQRNQAARGAAAARVAQARLALEGMERRVDQEVRVAIERLASAHEAADAYAGDTIAALEENLALSTEAYRAGKFDFLQLMLVRRDTLEARRGYVEALFDLAEAEAELDRAIGGAP